MSTKIPARLLPLLGTVSRYSTTTDDFAEVIVEIPCRLALHKDGENTQGYARTSETEIMLFFCNRRFNGDDVDLRYDDRIVIGDETYRVLSAHDAESQEHHIEADVEHMKDLSTSP